MTLSGVAWPDSALRAGRPRLRPSSAGYFAHGPFRRFFLQREGAEVYPEKEIVDERGNAYKADRIIIGDDGVDVIDFKTGETRSSAHVEQISNYGRLLQQIHKGAEVKSTSFT